MWKTVGWVTLGTGTLIAMLITLGIIGLNN